MLKGLSEEERMELLLICLISHSHLPQKLYINRRNLKKYQIAPDYNAQNGISGVYSLEMSQYGS